MELISSSEARARGLTRYFNGKPCPQGHVAERLVKGGCAKCKNEAKKAWTQKNRARVNEYQNRRYHTVSENKRRVISGNLRRKYGISLEEFERMSREQGGVCAICRENCEQNPRLCVDHDHSDGRLRGLLCSKCNMGLGYFRDRPELLKEAARYLAGPRLEEKD